MTESIESIRVAFASRYLIEMEIGAGGMATVYLAQDLRHHRKVAIKVLRPELAAVIGSERFLAEIRTTANLQHPHILPLFDSGQMAAPSTLDSRPSTLDLRPSTFLFYVMPFVEGESLRDRLDREKQLSVPDALRIASEVSSALDYAHRQGVIHRDIKPENVLLQDGQALVADFGIALALSSASGNRITETGLSLGTPQYMSPEQAMGERDITARSDIFSLGVITYEMLAGNPPFAGGTAQAIVSRIITDDPVSLCRHRKSVPEHVDDAVLTALEKLPADRFPTAAAFAEQLVAQPGRTSGTRRKASAKYSGRNWWLAAAAAGLAAALGVAAGLGLAGTGKPDVPGFGQADRLTWQPGLEIQPAISPDGKFVAYAAGIATGTRIFVRQISGGRVVPLTTDTTVVQSAPTWSPDGTRILFLAEGTVFSAPSSGGPARQEVPARAGSQVISAEFAPDGSTIAFAAGDSLFIKPADDAARFLAVVRSPNNCRWSPDSSLIACASGNSSYATIGPLFGNPAASAIVTVSVRDGNLTYLTDSTTINQTPVWSPDGHEIYFISNRHGQLDIYLARPGDPGEPLRLTTGLGAHSFSLSSDGSRLAYSVLRDVGNIWSLKLSRGTLDLDQAVPVTQGTLAVDAFSVSRDGRWILYSADLAGNGDIYRTPASGGEVERLTTDPSGDFAPDLSPDRPELVFHSWRRGTRDIYLLPLDGGPLVTLAGSPRQEVMPRWSPDGSAIVLTYFDQAGGIAIVRRVPGGSWGAPVMRFEVGQWPSWSPDGRMLTFATGWTGGSLMVMPSDSGPARILVDAALPEMPSVERPFFSADGREIIFMSRNEIGVASFWSVPVEGGEPRMLIEFNDPTRPVYRPFWALEGGRIFFVIQEQQSETWVMDVTR